MRTLRRPMFRGGTTGTGVTSGLAPRQGYADNENNIVKQNDPQKISDIKDMSLDQLRELSKSMSYQPRGGNIYDFLTQFGLNIGSMPPTGNIFQTAATAAKEPYGKFLKGKQDAAQMGYASEADMFKTLIGAQAKILTGAAESGAGVKEGYSQKIGEGLDAIWALKDDLEAGDITQEEHDKAKNKIIKKLGPFMKDNPEIEKLFEVPDYADEAYAEHKAKFLTEKLMDDPTNPGMQVTQREYYSRPENKAELRRLATESYMNEFQSLRLGIAEGGRAGYLAGGPTMQAQQAPDETVPAEMTDLSEEELRRRLPPEVGDDVVKLLANSAEALEDFAMIKTAQDIARFNKKYGVDLTLPAEA